MTELAERPNLGETEARELTDRIRGMVTDLLPLIKEAFDRRADQALGYTTWADYCAAELSGVRIPLEDRPAMVAELRQNGMSQRAIGSALGVSVGTVNGDLRSGVQNRTPDAPIKGIDGKSYAPTQPARPEPDETPMPARQEVADAVLNAIDEQIAFDPDDVRRDAELAAVPAVIAAQFRSNFATALRRAGELRSFEPDRVAEVFAANFHNDIGRSLESIRDWCDRVERTHREQQRGGLRLISGGAA